jgi:glycosyltransferase involved in cell wall biosynthesis
MAADNEQLTELLARSGVSDAIELLGATNDPLAFHRSLDVLVSPSRTEGFPNVVAEAMAVGTAVIATDVGGTSEVLGGAGLLVPSEDPRALSDAMARLAKSPDERTRLGEIGESRATASFSIRSTEQATLDLYELSAAAQARRSRRCWLQRRS